MAPNPSQRLPWQSAIIILVIGLSATAAPAAWDPVPPLASSPPKSQFVAWELYFSDADYEVPYYLRHFAQVANAVVENSFTDASGTFLPRGFLNIKVNRKVADNKPYNARIMEMQMALAYFYTVNRPWNPYRGSAPVRQRLEAMLARWVEMQHPTTGLFTEYSPTNWGLAPTAFGAMAAAQSLYMIETSGLAFDQTVFHNAKAALRRALMAVLTSSEMRAAARGYSNQFSPAYHAAALYLELWPDAPLDAALVAAVQAASNEDQSRSGYFYEANGPDFGYSNVHERMLRIALTRLRNRTNDILPVLNTDEVRWSGWLAANLVLQPNISTPTFMINGGINTRTSTGWQTPESRPFSEFVPLSRAFSYTGAEFTNTVRAKTDGLPSTPTYGPLATNNAYSYQPSFVYEALQRTETWHPSDGQRAEAMNSLPYLASTRFNRILHDARRPLSVAAVRRPAYYGLFNYGNVTVANQVKLGLGLLWNPSFGTFLQAVAGGTNTVATTWGTQRVGAAAAYEQRTTNSNLAATVRVGGSTIIPVNGTTNLADGVVSATYNLVEGSTTFGSKSVTFEEDRVKVEVAHTNTTNRVFSERLPLVAPASAVLTTNGQRLTLAHTNGSRLVLQLAADTPASFSVGAASTANLPSGLQRRAVTITATNALAYELFVTSDFFTAGPLGTPVTETYAPANGGADAGETVTYNLSLVNLLGASTSTNFHATLQASGGVVPVTTNRVYGALAPGATATQPFSFTVDGNFGDPLTITLELRDGPTNYGTVSYQTVVGGLSAGITTDTLENFDGVTAPALPSGWVSNVPVGSGGGWATAATAPHSAPNAVAAVPTASVSEQNLESRAFVLPAAAVDPEIRFQHRWNTESAYDGGVLEISVEGGAFMDILTAGGSFLSGAYSGTLSTGHQNPLGGRQAWFGSADASYTQTRIALPVSMLGQSVRLRFRLGCDSSVSPSGAIWRVDTLQFAYRAPNYILPAEITSAPPPGSVPIGPGSSYTHTFTAAGYPAPGFAVTSGTLPTGLSLSPSGVLSGSLTNLFSPRTITVTASNGVTPLRAGASQTFTLQALAALSVSTASLAGGTAGSTYSATLAATGGRTPYTWSLDAGALPDGLALSPSGVIGGTPLAAGTANFTVIVTDANGTTASRALAINTVNPASLTVVTPSLPGGQVGTPYAADLSAAGSAGPYTWSLASGSLPAGLQLSSSGVIGGTPTTSGGGIFTVRVTDGAAATATRVLSITVTGVLDITTRALPEARTGTAYTAVLGVSGGAPPFTWTTVAGALPPGLALAADGTISGTASALGTYTFTVRATDSLGDVAEQEYTLPAVNTLTWDAQPATPGIQNGNGTWTTADNTTNWSFGGTNVAWVNGSDAVIGGGTLTVATPVTVGGLTFNGGTTLAGAGQTMTVKPGAVIAATGADATIATRLEGVSFTKDGTNRLILSDAAYGGDVNIAAGELRVTDTSGVREWSGVISGSGSLLKLGSGTVVLGGASTFTGPATLAGQSVLRLAHGSALGATNGTTRLNGDSNNAPSIQLEGGIVVPETFQLVMWTPSAINTNANHAQIRNLSGTNELSGQIGVDAGGGRWDLASDDGHLKVSGPVVNVAQRAATNADTWRTLHLRGPGSGEFTGAMTDAANGFSKLNVTVLSGTWTLGGTAKAYTGNTIVNDGVLRVETALASEVRLLGGTLDGAGAISANLLVGDGATVVRRLTDWTAPGPAFTAAQVRGTNATAWTVRVDAAGLTNFSETPLVLPVLAAAGGAVALPPAAAVVETENFPGAGTWSVQTNATGVVLAYDPVLLAIATDSLPEATVGEFYHATFAASGGVDPRDWSLVAGGLPPGLNLSSGGSLTGTPLAGGTWFFTVRVTDAAGVAVERGYTLPVTAPLAVLTAALQGATVGGYHSEHLQAAGGSPGYTWSLLDGALPPGISLAPDGELVGTPAAAGRFAFTVGVLDAAEATASAALAIQVAPAPGSYDNWADRWRWPDEAARAAEADPDGDGLSNLLECAFDLDPLAAGEPPYRVASVLVGDQPHLRLTFRRSAAAPLFVYTVEGSHGLSGASAWSPLAVGERDEPMSAVDSAVEIEEVPLPDGAVEVTLTEPMAPGVRARFLRVEVREVAP